MRLVLLFSAIFIVTGCTTHHTRIVQIHDVETGKPAANLVVKTSPVIPFVFNAKSQEKILNESGETKLRLPAVGCYLELDGESKVMLSEENIKTEAKDLRLTDHYSGNTSWRVDVAKP